MGTILLEVSNGRDLGALEGLINSFFYICIILSCTVVS